MKETKFRKLLKGITKDYTRKTPSLDWQLGCMVGEYIVATQLPTLSTDMLKTRFVIDVNEELTKEWEQKSKEYRVIGYGTPESTKKFYENLVWYKENIEKIYLEKEIKVLVPRVDPTDQKEFEKGIEDALWECDLSHYRFKKMQPNNEYNVRTVIILSYEK